MNKDLERIIACVALRHGVQPSALRSSNHNRKAVACRRVVAICMREIGYSYPEIGVLMGCNHTTIMRLVTGKAGNKATDLDSQQAKLAAAVAEAEVVIGLLDIAGGTKRAGRDWRAGVSGPIIPPEPVDHERSRFRQAVDEFRAGKPGEREKLWLEFCMNAFPNSWWNQACAWPV